MKNYSLVKNYFPLYNKIFFQKNSVGEFLPCKECSNAPCERIDKVTFLPFESRFILKSLNLKKKRYKMCTVMRIETGKNNKCPFLGLLLKAKKIPSGKKTKSDNSRAPWYGAVEIGLAQSPSKNKNLPEKLLK